MPAADAIAKSRVGEIVSSMLSEDQFVKINGEEWVLADGRAVAGTLYAQLVSPHAPDLRGVFLRGKNYRRTPINGNIDGDLPVGTFQQNAFAKHSHKTIQMVHNNLIDGVDSIRKFSNEHHNEERETQVAGDSYETRPNCVTVNFYICIN